MGMIDEMKQDLTNDVVDAILDDKKTQEMMKIADPFIKPALKGLLKELGHDQKRFMLYLDTETNKLIFLTIKTENLTEFKVEGIDMEKDVFIVDPEEIKQGNVKEVIKAIIKKVGVKMM